MLASRERGRFERARARGKRASGRASVAAMLGRLSTRSLLVGLTVVAVAVGLGGFYASRSALEPRNADLALRGRPTASPEPVQETHPVRPAETRQANPPETHEAKATDARQAHLHQLQPVQPTDADRMSQVARRVRAEGRLPVELRSLFTSHRVLSADLHNHYPEYSEAKERLRKSVTEQEEEFQQTIQLVTTKLALAPVAEPRRSEVAWALL